MCPQNFFSSWAVTFMMAFSSMLQAATSIPLGSLSLEQLQQKLSLPAKLSLTQQKEGLKVVHEHKDFNQVHHVRLQQFYAGYPVRGGYAILHGADPFSLSSPPNNLKATLTGAIYQGLTKDLGAEPADFKNNGMHALMAYKKNFDSSLISEEKMTPMVYLDEANQAHWSYKVSFLVTYEDKIPERPTAILNASTFKPYLEWDEIKTKRMPVQGWGFGGNHKMGKHQFGVDLPFLEILRDPIEKICYMENKHVKVVNMKHKYMSKNNAMKFVCLANSWGGYFTGYEGDGYDKKNGAASPTNDALYAGQVIKRMYYDWYKLQVLTQSDGSPMKLVMRVHYGYNYENAYWDGKQMTFGDGDSLMHPLVSLGISAHEISHGFTEQHSNLEYYGQSGGINEAFSDMASQAVEYFSTGNNSWQIGGEILKKDSELTAIRYMEKPSLDGISIDTADEYYTGLDVHYSSGVYNRLFYLLAHKKNWNTRLAFDVMIKANMDYWTPYTNFEEGGCGILKATQDLHYSLRDVKSALEAVAINVENCALNPEEDQ